MKLRPKAIASILTLSIGLGAPIGAFAQSTPQATIHVANPATSQRLVLARGKSAVIDLPVDARDVVVANPTVADAVMRTSRRGFLIGMTNGETNVYFLDANGRQILSLEVSVTRDTSELASLVQRLVPEARVTFDAIGDSIVINGEVPNAGVSDRVIRLARQYVGNPDNVVNMMNVRSGDVVMLRVRVVEMQRTVIKQLGVNMGGSNLLNQLLPEDWGMNIATANGFAANGSFLGGTTVDAKWATNFITPQTYTFDSGSADLLNPALFAGAGGYTYTPPVTTCEPDPSGGAPICNTTPGSTTYGPGNLTQNESATSTIQALERVGLARTLAEPNLTAISGESARFLAGGEFPVPVSQEGSQISVEFKPFGVGLGFTPVVLSPNRISLKVSTEVSEISTAASFRQPDTVIRNAQGVITDTIRGLSIPGVSTRRAETTLELPSGRSMIMAGLIQEQTRQSVEGLPGLKDLPVLGNLFRSRDFQNSETELVIIITPYLVQSTNMSQLQTPADGYNPASDASTLLMGRLNRIVRPSSSGSPPSGRYNAPIGHVMR